MSSANTNSSDAQPKRQGTWLFVLLVGLAAAGGFFVVKDLSRVPSRDAQIDGLSVHLDEARWILDQMDHGENFQKPSTMMPDMPEWGMQRVTLDLTFENLSDGERIYDGREFFLVPELGDEVPPIGAQTGSAKVQPGQRFNTAIHFDFDTRDPHGRLRVAWRRGDQVAWFPIPEPAEHYHLRPRGGEVALPQRASLVQPLGDAGRGERLYDAKYGCVACHGDPLVPDSNNVGPHLAQIGTTAATRIEGVDAAQYIYDSIIKPDSFIAPECKGGRPCSEPTAMPEYASLVTVQDLADLLVYLVEQRGSVPAAEAEVVEEAVTE